MNSLGYFGFFSVAIGADSLSHYLSREKVIFYQKANQYAPKKAKPWMGSVLPGTEKALTLIRKQ